MRHALLALLLATAPAVAGTPLPEGPHVTASGEGKVSVAPDMARIQFTARYRNASPAAAKQAVDRSVEAFLDLAPGFGLEPAHVTAGDLSGLKTLVEAAKDRFAFGVVLYDGDTIVPFGERLAAAPISCLWR